MITFGAKQIILKLSVMFALNTFRYAVLSYVDLLVSGTRT